MKTCPRCNRQYTVRTVAGVCYNCYQRRFKKPRKTATKSCLICGQNFCAVGQQIGTKLYCSVACLDTARKQGATSENTKRYKKQWAKQNRDKTRQNGKRCYEKSKADLLKRLRGNLVSRLRFKMGPNRKLSASIVAIQNLGCSIEQLHVHLESKFQLGMTWENYGRYGWHVDHIVALANFDVSNIEHLKYACHYTNLQPLWAEDNLSKGSK
jgi:hypothetical protein